MKRASWWLQAKTDGTATIATARPMLSVTMALSMRVRVKGQIVMACSWNCGLRRIERVAALLDPQCVPDNQSYPRTGSKGQGTNGSHFSLCGGQRSVIRMRSRPCQPPPARLPGGCYRKQGPKTHWSRRSNPAALSAGSKIRTQNRFCDHQSMIISLGNDLFGTNLMRSALHSLRAKCHLPTAVSRVSFSFLSSYSTVEISPAA